ncbi:MAG TPA: metallophosphoesterase [Burkholderiales bacterium]|nr:metallophosphoesterase [Burkholderiales bacterium]
MTRFFNRFVLTVTAILAAAYAYVAWRLDYGPAIDAALAIPFALVWIVPVLYWGTDKERHGALDHALHIASYVSMGWLSFVVPLTLLRDVLQLTSAPLAAALHLPVVRLVLDPGLVLAGALLALAAGMLGAFRGPRIRRVDVAIADLPSALHGFRIAQISDLHVGLTLGRRYVRRVVDMTRGLEPDLIALTGDMVDGPVARLAGEVEPLAELPAVAPTYCVWGNHEYYSGLAQWTRQFAAMRLPVLENASVIVRKNGARMLVAGVTDPAARHYDPGRMPRPDVAAGREPADFRLLLAHHPQLAPAAAQAGYDLQLSGHTHAGQFFPWTLAVRLVHAPHVAGLSREGRMWVYVSAGTGTWGPPVRFGTTPELTLLTLVPAP